VREKFERGVDPSVEERRFERCVRVFWKSGGFAPALGRWRNGTRRALTSVRARRCKCESCPAPNLPFGSDVR